MDSSVCIPNVSKVENPSWNGKNKNKTDLITAAQTNKQNFLKNNQSKTSQAPLCITKLRAGGTQAQFKKNFSRSLSAGKN